MITLSSPWLEYDLGAPHQVLSWSVNRPGYHIARRVLWRELRNADLPPDLDVRAWLAQELAARGAEDAVCLLTSRRIDRHVRRDAREGAVRAQALATVGLSNAERVGQRMDRSGRDWNLDPGSTYGTINIAVRLDHPLSQTGLLEALSIATQARTAAIIDSGHTLPHGPATVSATGTGTDCIAVAAPEGADDYAGLHTDTGAALGRAVYAAVLQGALDWIDTIGRVSDTLEAP
ncbi:MAG TPA: adenosylcobinamide amidohydrolase [Paracoccus sp.]|nr:adenosylcobinamide amidohydrolase [Paracoccus sp. (in: a-proteobacteria)]